jgi:hypothetical protein
VAPSGSTIPRPRLPLEFGEITAILPLPIHGSAARPEEARRGRRRRGRGDGPEEEARRGQGGVEGPREARLGPDRRPPPVGWRGGGWQVRWIWATGAGVWKGQGC